MAEIKGKVGGRKLNQGALIRTCEECGKTDENVIRIKYVSGTGRSRMMWLCKEGCK